MDSKKGIDTLKEGVRLVKKFGPPTLKLLSAAAMLYASIKDDIKENKMINVIDIKDDDKKSK